MALTTGSPIGNLDTSEELYLEGAPYIYYQSVSATPLFNPDASGFYWGLSGTTAYPVYELGCATNITLTENLTMNDVLCDNVGVKSTIMQRNYVEFTLSIQQFFPFQNIAPAMKGSAVTQVNPTQKFGIGQIDQNVYYMLYCAKVYDQTAGDYIWFHFHRAQFVDAWTINFTFGTPWQLTNVKFRAFADTTKPTTQQFGMWGRSDLSAVV